MEDVDILTIIELILDKPEDQGTLYHVRIEGSASRDSSVPFQLQILLKIDISYLPYFKISRASEMENNLTYPTKPA